MRFVIVELNCRRPSGCCTRKCLPYASNTSNNNESNNIVAAVGCYCSYCCCFRGWWCLMRGWAEFDGGACCPLSIWLGVFMLLMLLAGQLLLSVLRVVNAADGDVIAIVGVFMSAILSRHREFFHSQSNRTELSMWLCCCCRCHRWIKIHWMFCGRIE